MIGTAGGPLVLGALYDVSDSYRLPYALTGACSLLGAGALALGGPATVDPDPPPDPPVVLDLPGDQLADGGQASTRMS